MTPAAPDPAAAASAPAPAVSPAAPRPQPARARILERYLLREVIGPIGLAFALYTYVMLMNQFFLLAEYAYRFQVPVGKLGRLFALQVPHVVVLTIPIALLVGLLVATARLAADSELVALAANGISFAALLRPALLLALVFTLLTGWLSFDLMPRANHAINRTIFEVFRQSLLRNVREREFNARLLPGYVFYVRDISEDEAGELWRGVLLEPLASPQSRGRREVFFAREARPSVDEEAGVMVLTFRDVSVHALVPGSATSYEVRTLAEFSKLLPPPPLLRQVGDPESSKSVRERTLPELFEEAQSDATRSIFAERLVRLEIHKRFAIPGACLVFAFLGLGLGANARRSARSFGFVASLVVVLVYYQFFYAGEQLAKSGDLPPWLSMWAGDLLFGALGALLFLERTTEGRLLRWFRRAGAAADPRRLLRRLPRLRRAAEGGAAVGRTRHLLLGLPSLLDRYLVREFLRVFSLVLVSAVALYVQVTLFQILDDILTNEVPFATVVDYYVTWLPEILTYVLPVSGLMTTVVTFSLLTRTNEVTAMMVNGVSLYRVVAPVVAIGLVLTALTGLLYDRVLPRASERHDEIYDVIRGRGSRARVMPARWGGGEDGRHLYHFDAYRVDRGVLEKLSFFELDAGSFAPLRHVFALRARWKGERLVLSHGWQREFRDGAEVVYTPFRERELPTEGLNRRDFGREWRQAKHMTRTELADFVRYRRETSLGTRDLEIDLAARRSYPFITLVMLLLGLPFAFAVGRRGSLYGIAVAIALAVLFWSAVAVTTYLGKLGVLPPLVAAWSPNLVFSFLGLAAFLNLRT